MLFIRFLGINPLRLIAGTNAPEMERNLILRNTFQEEELLLLRMLSGYANLQQTSNLQLLKNSTME